MDYGDIAILHGISNRRASPQNVLAGLTPTISSFTVDPSNPENITDADPTNPAGVGTKQPGGIEVIGALEYDLGSPKYVEIVGLSKMWAATAIALYLYVGSKVNSGDSYVDFPNALITVAAAASSEPTNPVPFQYNPKLYGRYLKFYYKAGGSSTGNASMKPYELAAYEFKLAPE